jgi:hypothetical protein
MKWKTILTLVLLLMMSGCAKQIELVPDRKQPLPMGTINSVSEQGGRSRYELKINYLLPPEQLDDRATIYVVWARSASNNVMEKVAVVGKARDKKIIVETNLDSPQFAITAEPNANVTQPSGPMIIKEFYAAPPP